mmetsp:Transcript_72634/g.189465  ORF Transcript_72634/g.189465 Transcript_72634/m.189465 type:complete len:85 (+) Transcript_72634:65-319(+)
MSRFVLAAFALLLAGHGCVADLTTTSDTERRLGGMDTTEGGSGGSGGSGDDDVGYTASPAAPRAALQTPPMLGLAAALGLAPRR